MARSWLGKVKLEEKLEAGADQDQVLEIHFNTLVSNSNAELSEKCFD